MGAAASAALPERLGPQDIEALIRSDPDYGQVLARAPWLALKLQKKGHVAKSEAVSAWRDFGGHLGGGLEEAKAAVEHEKVSKRRLCAKFEGDLQQAAKWHRAETSNALDRATAAETVNAALTEALKRERAAGHRNAEKELKKRQTVLAENARLSAANLELDAKLHIAQRRCVGLEAKLTETQQQKKKHSMGINTATTVEVLSTVSCSGLVPLRIRALEVEALTAALASLKSAEEHHEQRYSAQESVLQRVMGRIAVRADGQRKARKWETKFRAKLQELEESKLRAGEDYKKTATRRPALLEAAMRSLAVEVQRVESSYSEAYRDHLTGDDTSYALKSIADVAERVNRKTIKNLDQRPSKDAEETILPGQTLGNTDLGFALRLCHDAQRAMPALEAIAEKIASELPGATLIRAPLKSLERALEKTHLQNGGRYDALKDLARCSIACADVCCVQRCLIALEKACSLVRVKDRLSTLEFNEYGEANLGYDAALRAGGYRDMLLNVQVGLEDGCSHFCEVQIHLQPFLEIKQKGGGHQVYAISRSLRASDDEFVKIEGSLGPRELERVGCGVALQLSCANTVETVPRSLLTAPTCRLLDVVLSENPLRVDLRTLLGAKPLCVSLRRLMLNDCELTGPVCVDTLKQLISLQVVLLQDNRLSGKVDLKAIEAEMPSLKVLRLSNNPRLHLEEQPDDRLRKRCFLDLRFSVANNRAPLHDSNKRPLIRHKRRQSEESPRVLTRRPRLARGSSSRRSFDSTSSRDLMAPPRRKAKKHVVPKITLEGEAPEVQLSTPGGSRLDASLAAARSHFQEVKASKHNRRRLSAKPAMLKTGTTPRPSPAPRKRGVSKETRAVSKPRIPALRLKKTGTSPQKHKGEEKEEEQQPRGRSKEQRDDADDDAGSPSVAAKPAIEQHEEEKQHPKEEEEKSAPVEKVEKKKKDGEGDETTVDEEGEEDDSCSSDDDDATFDSEGESGSDESDSDDSGSTSSSGEEETDAEEDGTAVLL